MGPPLVADRSGQYQPGTGGPRLPAHGPDRPCRRSLAGLKGSADSSRIAASEGFPPAAAVAAPWQPERQVRLAPQMIENPVASTVNSSRVFEPAVLSRTFCSVASAERSRGSGKDLSCHTSCPAGAGIPGVDPLEMPH